MKKENQRFVTLVTDEKGIFSIHSSYKQACDDYGWEREKYIPPSVGEYKIKKHPMNVTIDCLELIEFISRKNVNQSSEEIDGTYHIQIDGYSKGYDIVAEFAAIPYEAEHLDGDRGSEMMSSGGIANELTEILQVTKHDADGTEIKIDSYTQKELLNLINID